MTPFRVRETAWQNILARAANTSSSAVSAIHTHLIFLIKTVINMARFFKAHAIWTCRPRPIRAYKGNGTILFSLRLLPYPPFRAYVPL